MATHFTASAYSTSNPIVGGGPSGGSFNRYPQPAVISHASDLGSGMRTVVEGGSRKASHHDPPFDPDSPVYRPSGDSKGPLPATTNFHLKPLYPPHLVPLFERPLIMKQSTSPSHVPISTPSPVHYSSPATSQYASHTTPQYAPHTTPQYASHTTPQYASHTTPQYASPTPVTPIRATPSPLTPQYASHTPQYASHTPQYASHTPQYASHTPQYAPPAPVYTQSISFPPTTRDPSSQGPIFYRSASSHQMVPREASQSTHQVHAPTLWYWQDESGDLHPVEGLPPTKSMSMKGIRKDEMTVAPPSVRTHSFVTSHPQKPSKSCCAPRRKTSTARTTMRMATSPSTLLDNETWTESLPGAVEPRYASHKSSRGGWTDRNASGCPSGSLMSYPVSRRSTVPTKKQQGCCAA